MTTGGFLHWMCMFCVHVDLRLTYCTRTVWVYDFGFSFLAPLRFIYTDQKQFFWWFVRVTLVVAFGFSPQNFERWWGPINDGFTQK